MSNAHPRPWHRGSLFGPGPRRPLNREQRAVWRARLTLFRRARKLTPLYEDIGLAMLKRLSADGQLDPSHQTVADDVGCNARSVRRALTAFRACGLICWVQRLVRTGWRCVQTSNSYMMTIGHPPASAVSACGGQAGQQTEKIDIPTVQPASPEAVVAAQDALAKRRAVVEARLLGKVRR
jgi:hypothetical protein